MGRRKGSLGPPQAALAALGPVKGKSRSTPMGHETNSRPELRGHPSSAQGPPEAAQCLPVARTGTRFEDPVTSGDLALRLAVARDGLPSTPSQAPSSRPGPGRPTEPAFTPTAAKETSHTDLCPGPSCLHRRGSGTARPLPGRKTEPFSGATFAPTHVSPRGGDEQGSRPRGQTALKTPLGGLSFGCPASLGARPPGVEVGRKAATCQKGLGEVCKVVPAEFSKGSKRSGCKGRLTA